MLSLVCDWEGGGPRQPKNDGKRVSFAAPFPPTLTQSILDQSQKQIEIHSAQRLMDPAAPFNWFAAPPSPNAFLAALTQQTLMLGGANPLNAWLGYSPNMFVIFLPHIILMMMRTKHAHCVRIHCQY